MMPSLGIQPAEIGDGPMDDATILASKLQSFQAMIEKKDRSLMHELWSEGDLYLVGSERGESCLTRDQIEAKLEAIFSGPRTLILEFPRTHIRIVGNAGWIFAEGVLTRRDNSGVEDRREYRAMCIFEKVEGIWHWRQYFGAEPY